MSKLIVDISDELKRRLKVQAVKENKTLKELVNEKLRKKQDK